MRVMLLAWCFSSVQINSHSSFFLLFSCFVVWLFCCLVVLLSGCFVDCIVYTFNKITKPLNNKTTILNIDILFSKQPTTNNQQPTTDNQQPITQYVISSGLSTHTDCSWNSYPIVQTLEATVSLRVYSSGISRLASFFMDNVCDG